MVDFAAKKEKSAVQRCAGCSVTLGTLAQDALPGTGGEALCANCQRDRMALHYMKMLPGPDDEHFDDLGQWEQEFLTSVRRQFNRRRTVTEKQFAVLERIYKERGGN